MAAGLTDRLWEVADLVTAWEASERRAESGMKLTLRLVLVPVSLAVAFLFAIWGERFTLAPLGNNRYEGTPATVLEFFTVFPLVSIVLLIAGNLAISCYFSSTKSCSTAYRLYEHMTRTILTCWIAGAAFAGLLIVLDIECVHSACQDIVMFLSLLPLIA